MVNQARDSSDSDVDSDSSNFSEDERFVNNYANIRQKGQVPNRQPLLKKSNVVRVTPSDPDVNADVLQQNLGFKKVGASSSKVRVKVAVQPFCMCVCLYLESANRV